MIPFRSYEEILNRRNQARAWLSNEDKDCLERTKNQ